MLQESLSIFQRLGDLPSEAEATVKLAKLYLLTDLGMAKIYAEKALQISMMLGIEDDDAVYETLFRIAQAQGDSAAASKWAQKREEIETSRTMTHVRQPA